MYLKKKTVKGKIYLAYVKSYRENGKTKQKTVLSLGPASDYTPESLKAIAKKYEKLAEEKIKENKDSIKQKKIKIKKINSDEITESNKTKTIEPLEKEDLELVFKEKKDNIFINHNQNLLTRDENKQDKSNQTVCLNWGAALVVKKIWDSLSLDNLILKKLPDRRKTNDTRHAIFNTVLNRITSPSSKLKTKENQNSFMNIKNVDLHFFYRSLDFLADNKDFFEEELFKIYQEKIKKDNSIVCYDVTTLYFESVNPNNIKNFGYSKDGKFGEVQVVVGLTVTTDGYPIGFDIFSGNTFEGKTLESAILKLKNRYNVKHVTFVSDRGMMSKSNLALIKEHDFYYVIGCKLRSMSKKTKNKFTKFGEESKNNCLEYANSKFEKDFTIVKKTIQCSELEEDFKDVSKKNKNKDIQNHLFLPKTVTQDEKIILIWSQNRAKKDQKDRERLLKKAQNIIKNPNLLNSVKGYKKYLILEKNKILGLNIAKSDEDSKWDGLMEFKLIIPQ